MYSGGAVMEWIMRRDEFGRRRDAWKHQNAVLRVKHAITTGAHFDARSRLSSDHNKLILLCLGRMFMTGNLSLWYTR
jgi:hypothetical protein